MIKHPGKKSENKMPPQTQKRNQEQILNYNIMIWRNSGEHIIS